MARTDQRKTKPEKPDAKRPEAPARPRLVLTPKISIAGHRVDPDDLAIFKDMTNGNSGDMVSGPSAAR